jgi:hypothetical protein
VLKTAIALLIDEGAPATPPLRLHNGPIPTRDRDRWDALRRRLRELVNRDRKGRIEVALHLGVAVTTLARLLGPNSDGPGIAVIERAEAWLSAAKGVASIDTLPLASNGAASAHAEPTAGNDASPLPQHRLSVAQRERLAAFASLDPMELRRKAGVTPEVVDQAVAGQDLATEIIERLAAFLEAAPGE